MKFFSSSYSFAALFVLSFAAALMPFSAYEAESFLISFVLLGAAVLQGFLVLRADQALVISKSVVVIGAAFWALAGLSAILSEAPYVSFIFFCFFSALPLSLLLTTLVDDKKKFSCAVGAGIAVLLAALSIFTIYEYFFLPEWLHKGYAHWPLADPNSLASVLSLAFFCAFGLMLGASSRVGSNAGLVLCILYMAAIFTTGSQGGLYALLAALAIFCFCAQPFVRKHWRCCAILAIVSTVVFALFSHYALRPPSESFMDDGNLDIRSSLVLATWKIFMDHFWTGTGIGTFFLYYPAYRAGDLNTAGFMAHSDPLQFASEMGVLAPILFYAFATAAVVVSIKKILQTNAGDTKRILILVPFCALGAIVVHSHVNFPFNILPLLMMCGALIGFWQWQIGGNVVSIKHVPRQVAAFALVIVLMAFAGLQGGEILTTRAHMKLERGDMNGFMRDVNLAGEISLYQNARAYALAVTIPIGVLEVAESRHIPPEERRKLFERAERQLNAAENLNSRMPSVPYYRARLYQAWPTSDKDPDYFLEQALKLDQMHTPSRLMLAERMAKDGKRQEALDLLMAGIEWPNVSAEYYQRIAMLARDLGDMETHDTAMAKMLIANARQMSTIYKSKTALRP